MEEILKGLNPAQREAVETLSGPVLILAGAGSGKTKTLTHRIANLIAHGIDPQHILAVTFTNKAAREMRQRLWQLLEPDSVGGPSHYFMPFMGTFHGIAVRILREDGLHLGIPRDFVIYDVDDQITLIRQVIKAREINVPTNLKPKMIQSMISNAKNEGKMPEDCTKEARFPDMRTVAKIFKYYEIEKNNAGALDFDDLILKELRLFQKFPEVRKKWQTRFQHILIDEYQDTNNVQYQIVKLLVGEEQNICAVGDDWQSIYSWRGADFTNILHFERDFPGAKVIKLEQNYRSSGNILAAAQQVIQNNQTRTDKNLFTEAGKGEPVRVEITRNEEAEAMFVASTISLLETQSDFHDFSDFAVLYRTNAQSYAFEKVFMNMRIPYKIVGGVRFYDRKEVKDMLAVLRLVANQRDKVSLERVMKNVLRGVGQVSIERVMKVMDTVEGERPLSDVAVVEVLKTAKAKNAVLKLAGFLKKVAAEEIENPATIIEIATKHFDFAGLIEGASPDESDERLRNIEVLAANAADYDSLAEFLADAALMSSADEEAGRNSVTLMTIHAAKGLEFPVVFLVGMEEGLFPSSRAVAEGNIEEERRLAYVGMTRAMKQLYLTYANSRYAFGGRHYNIQSEFLSELGVEPRGTGGYLDADGDGMVDTKVIYRSDQPRGLGSEDWDEEEVESIFNDTDDWDDDPFPEDVPIFD